MWRAVWVALNSHILLLRTHFLYDNPATYVQEREDLLPMFIDLEQPTNFRAPIMIRRQPLSVNLVWAVPRTRSEKFAVRIGKLAVKASNPGYQAFKHGP